MGKEYSNWEQTKHYVVRRFLLKSALPYVLTSLLATALNNPNWVALAPVLQVAEKFLRDKGYWFKY